MLIPTTGVSLMLAGVLVLLASDVVSAQAMKTSGAGKPVVLLSEAKAFPKDKDKHEVVLRTRTDEITQQIPGCEKALVAHIGVTDATAGTGTDQGHRMVECPGGDKIFVAFEGKTTTIPREGQFPTITFDGTWRFTGGTGKYAGIHGGGTYDGHVTKEAGPAYKWVGEYEVKK